VCAGAGVHLGFRRGVRGGGDEGRRGRWQDRKRVGDRKQGRILGRGEVFILKRVLLDRGQA
jgi:hypothetical protein